MFGSRSNEETKKEETYTSKNI